MGARLKMNTKSGFLTILSEEHGEIYGEFADGTWATEKTGGGLNHVFTGAAGDGTVDTFRRLNSSGISNVWYHFESEGDRYSGPAQLLALSKDSSSGQVLVTIDTGVEPRAESLAMD